MADACERRTVPSSASCSGRRGTALRTSRSGGDRGEANAISAALSGHRVLTIGATGIFADRGANVGFDLEGGRPRIVINLGTSRAQHVELKAELLKLAQIVGSF